MTEQQDLVRIALDFLITIPEDQFTCAAYCNDDGTVRNGAAWLIESPAFKSFGLKNGAPWNADLPGFKPLAAYPTTDNTNFAVDAINEVFKDKNAYQKYFGSRMSAKWDNVIIGKGTAPLTDKQVQIARLCKGLE